MENFKQEDLKTGMLVKLRNGEIYKVYKGSELKDCILNEDEVFLYIEDYEEFEFISVSRRNLDIIEVYKSSRVHCLTSFDSEKFDLVWQESKTVNMTIKEIEQKLGVANLCIVKEN